MAFILLSSAKGCRDVTRAYAEYDTREELAKTVVDFYEDYLRTTTPNEGLEYRSNELFDYIDNFFDELVCLERQANCPDLYIPYTSTYVKELIYAYLRSQCLGPEEESGDNIQNGECANNGQSTQIHMDTSWLPPYDCYCYIPKPRIRLFPK